MMVFVWPDVFTPRMVTALEMVMVASRLVCAVGYQHQFGIALLNALLIAGHGRGPARAVIYVRPCRRGRHMVSRGGKASDQHGCANG